MVLPEEDREVTGIAADGGTVVRDDDDTRRADF